MARQLRLEYEGAIYHVTVRGNGREDMFLDDADRTYFLKRLSDGIEQCGIRLYLYCLMNNHFHLVFETPRANLSAFMHGVLTGYGVVFNHRHRRSGHVTQGRYGAKLVSGDEYLLKLSRYVHLNPIKTKSAETLPAKKRTERLRSYEWSSYRSYIGEAAPLPFVDYAPMLSLAGKGSRKRRQTAYRAFVEAMIGAEDEAFLGELWRSSRSIGGESFREWVDDCFTEMIRARSKREDIAFRRIESSAIPPDAVLGEVSKAFGIEPSELLRRRRDSAHRGVAGLMLCEYADFSQRQVAETLGLRTGAAVSYQLAKIRERIAEDAKQGKTVAQIRRALNRKRKK